MEPHSRRVTTSATAPQPGQAQQEGGAQQRVWWLRNATLCKRAAASCGRRQWVTSQERSSAAKLERLEAELSSAKANLIKESIRMGHNDLGDHFYARGDLQVGRGAGRRAGAGRDGTGRSAALLCRVVCAGAEDAAPGVVCGAGPCLVACGRSGAGTARRRRLERRGGQWRGRRGRSTEVPERAVGTEKGRERLLVRALSPAQNAFKSYVRMRDYCTSPKHILQMCLSLIRVSLELNNLLQVGNYVSKAESTPDTQVRTVCVCVWGGGRLRAPSWA